MPYTLPAQLETGGSITQTDTSITVQFDEVHYSMSTSHLNGGLHHTLAVRNQKLTYQVEKEYDLPGGSVANYLGMEFQHIDVPDNFGTALLTTAAIEDAVYAKEQQDDTIVEVIVTAGFEKTATCPGSGYKYIERDGDYFEAGTINLLVFTNKALTDGAMARALITITEAKSVALRAEGIKSIDSDELATGTATDGIILTIDTSGNLITDTGAYSLFGDTIAKAVIKGLRQIIREDKAKQAVSS